MQQPPAPDKTIATITDSPVICNKLKKQNQPDNKRFPDQVKPKRVNARFPHLNK